MKNVVGKFKLQSLVDVFWASWQMLMFRSAKAHAHLLLNQGREEDAAAIAVLFLMVRWDVGLAAAFSVLAINLVIAFVCLAFGAAGRRFLLSFMCASIAVDGAMIFVNIMVPKELVTDSVVRVSNVIEMLVFIAAGQAGYRQVQLDAQRLKEQGH